MTSNPRKSKRRNRPRAETTSRADLTRARTDSQFSFNATIDLHGDEATAVSVGAFFVRGENNKLESNSFEIYDDQPNMKV